MNPEIIAIYKEIKDYIISDRYGWTLKENAPKEVQEKFKKMMELEDDEIFVENIEEFINTTL
ncbi:MAG: hypothetical protein HFI36_02775 [Bacilli bacterium]|jgi:hypothetical protein|nr:hypothetical protein [Bacilli bacterium]